MREWVNDCWNSVMNLEHNPLRNIPDLHARHMIMQILAWIWCMVFSFYVGSNFVFVSTNYKKEMFKILSENNSIMVQFDHHGDGKRHYKFNTSESID